MDKEFGRVGAKRYGGLFYEEFLPELQGVRGVRVYEEMSENDGLFDDLGELVGVKADAPPEFKEAYEHDKKRREELEALGID